MIFCLIIILIGLILRTMTSSDSQPIQFWDVNEETANEKDVCGLVKQDCFCQPWECYDEIFVQFQSNSSLTMEIISGEEDTEGDVIGTEPLYEISPGFWQTSFIPASDWAICDQKVYLSIVSPILVSAPSVWEDSFIKPWFLPIPTETFITKTGTQFTTDTSIGQQGVMVRLPVSLPAGVTPNTITAPISFTGMVSGTDVLMFFGNGDLSSPSNISSIAPTITVGGINPTNPGIFVFPALTEPADYLYLYVDFSIDTGSFVGSITVNPTDEIYDGEIMRSDCLDIKTTQDCTKLISYSNSSNFDGIYYTQSPAPTFNLRIPAIFFEEDNPQDQEDIEQSNGRIITLRSTIQEKRKLDIGFVTNYLIKKIQKVLMHETIQIDGTYWKKRDSFDTSPINKYNLKRASVWLTKYNSVEKNTI